MPSYKNYPTTDLQETKQGVHLEKQLASIRMIRKNRLNRQEAEYQQKLKDLNAAKQSVDDAVAKVTYTQQAAVDGKQALRTEYLQSPTSLLGIQGWSEKDAAFDEQVFVAEQHQKKQEQQAKQAEQLMETAKKTYQKTLLSIEKLDLLKKELDAENNS